MFSKILRLKIGTDQTDRKLEQYALWIGGLIFFLMSILKFTSLEITNYEMHIGITLAAILMVLCCLLGHMIGSKNPIK